MDRITRTRILCLLACFLLSASLCAQSASIEPEITKAFIKDGKVHVTGKNAIPGEPVYWLTHHQWYADTPVVGTVDAQGNFQFTSEDLPALPQCMAHIVIGDTAQEMTIHVDKCEGKITSFYSLYLQDEEGDSIRTPVLPRERGYAHASCHPGDFAVSGEYFIHGDGNILPHASVLSSGIIIDGLSQIQSWGVTIANYGTTEITFGVSVQCAKVEPPASRTPRKKDKKHQH